MKNGRNISGTQIVRDMGLGEYEQRFLISCDDYGATLNQQPCDDLISPGVIPRPEQTCRLKSHRKNPARKYHHLMGIIKHNEAARSQLQKIKSQGYGKFANFMIPAYAASILALEPLRGDTARH